MTAASGTDVGIALLRVSVGMLVAERHGWHKVAQGWRYLTAGTDWPLVHDTIQLGFPTPAFFSIIVALIQYLGGWLLAVGLLTRPAAFLVASTLCAAVMLNLQTGGPHTELAGLYALVTGAFALIGGGRWSVDRATRHVVDPPRRVQVR